MATDFSEGELDRERDRDDVSTDVSTIDRATDHDYSFCMRAKLFHELS